MDLKPKGAGGLILEKCGPLSNTLWNLWPKGGGGLRTPQTPPPPVYGPESRPTAELSDRIVNSFSKHKKNCPEIGQA